MRVPSALTTAFGAEFETLISTFAVDQKLLPEPSAIQSTRFLSRSVIPHVQKLSGLFNRAADRDEKSEGAEEDAEEEAKARPTKAQRSKEQAAGLAPYWKDSSNPANLRLAYFLYFMPSNLYRVAAIWAELARLGYRWPANTPLKAIEFGAGPATGACGIAAGEKFAPTGIPMNRGSWALIEQDRAMLELGARWAERYFEHLGIGDWGTRTFHRRVELAELLPENAPKFNLWVMSYFLNESTGDLKKSASSLLRAMEKHLDDEGLVILSEPALKQQSRRLLGLRQALLEEAQKRGVDWLQVLTPCLGHQACGALAEPEDWCHEEVSWWRPPYFRVIDRMASLDRKTLPFTHLVITRSKRPREEILPALAGSDPLGRQRLVSPSHSQGKDLEFFVCGQEGKRRARFRPKTEEERVERGDVLLGAELRGDKHASRIEKVQVVR